MAKWVFEPGHTAAEFRARHMMVINVRGAFKIHEMLKPLIETEPAIRTFDVQTSTAHQITARKAA